MWLTVILVVIFVACLGLQYEQGMWNNAIRLVNVVTAALLATNFYEPVAGKLDSFLPSFTYAWDFVALWAVFAACMVVFRELSDRVSKVNVRFLRIADRVGGVFFALCVAWVLVCFTAMTLHTAPLARNFLSFKPEQRMLMGVAPDRQWLAFVQRTSGGQFSQQPPRIFDPNAEFLLRYATRRAKLQNQIETGGSLSTSR